MLGSADAKSNVSDDFPAKALFQLPKNVHLSDLLQFIMQSRLQNTDVKHSFAQGYRRGMGSNKLPDDVAPGVQHLAFVEALLQSESLH